MYVSIVDPNLPPVLPQKKKNSSGVTNLCCWSIRANIRTTPRVEYRKLVRAFSILKRVGTLVPSNNKIKHGTRLWLVPSSAGFTKVFTHTCEVPLSAQIVLARAWDRSIGKNRPLELRGHGANASLKQWVVILLLPKIDRTHKNYFTPEIWEETHWKEIFYGTLILQQSIILYTNGETEN